MAEQRNRKRNGICSVWPLYLLLAGFSVNQGRGWDSHVTRHQHLSQDLTPEKRRFIFTHFIGSQYREGWQINPIAMVTAGKSGFSPSLCLSLAVEEAVLYASAGLPGVNTLHYHVPWVCFFKNTFPRHLTYILHVLTLLRSWSRLYLFNPFI